MPATFKLSGGAGPSANKTSAFLAETEVPGDPKNDPRVARLRALWISHQRKRHSLCMARVRYSHMLDKRNLIRRKRAWAVCQPGPASSVGLNGMSLQQDLINGQPRGATCGADAANDQFDGKQVLAERGVPDDAFDLEVEGGATDGA